MLAPTSPLKLKLHLFRQVCRGRIYASRAVYPLYRIIGTAAAGGIYAAPTSQPVIFILVYGCGPGMPGPYQSIKTKSKALELPRYYNALFQNTEGMPHSRHPFCMSKPFLRRLRQRGPRGEHTFFNSLRRAANARPYLFNIGRTGAAGWAYWVSCADFCRALLRYSLGLVPSILRKHLEK